MEYFNLEPFESDRLEVQLAQISYLMAAFMGNKVDINSFMISKQEKKQESVEERVKRCFGI